MKIKKYNAWKSEPDGTPIKGTDRVLIGSSQRSVLKHLAHEEGTFHQHNDRLVRCDDGTIWHATLIR